MTLDKDQFQVVRDRALALPRPAQYGSGPPPRSERALDAVV